MSNDFTVNYTTRDVIEKIEKMNTQSVERDEAQNKILTSILEQTRATNGRVTALEKVSLGVWISKNPFKFLMIVLTFISILGLSVADVLSQTNFFW